MSLLRVSWPLLAFGLTLGLACKRAPRAAPTYSQQVAPLLERRCLPCHGSAAGSAGVSPALDSRESAARVATQVALSVERRRMPPWGADGTGSCGRFVDTPWLDDGEIRTLRAWADAGAPAGPLLRRVLRPAADGPQGPLAWLLEPAPGERRLSLPTRFTPGLGQDATRCFRADTGLDGDWALGALALKAEPPLAVQQLLLYALDEPERLADVARLEQEDAPPGWACYGDSRVPGSELVASWSWVQPVQRLPAGSRIRARPELPLVVQVRYNLLGAGLAMAPVHASVELVLRRAEHAGRLWPVSVAALRLPAGQRRVEALREEPLGERLDLLGVVPQMHGLGRTLVLERERRGERACLASFVHWNPAQQQLFRYPRAVELEPGDRLRLSCSFDTTSRSEDVLAGAGMDAEQCRAYLYVSERR